MESSDLNRTDITRKSIRLRTNCMPQSSTLTSEINSCEVPPTKIQQSNLNATADSSILGVESNLVQSPYDSNLTSTPENTLRVLRTNRVVSLRNPMEGDIDSVQLREQRIRNTASLIPYSKVLVKADIKDQRMLLTDEDDVVSFALGSIEKHINQMEESLKQSAAQPKQQLSIDELKIDRKKQSKRYGETENLLQPGISDMSSGADFHYLQGQSDVELSCSSEVNRFERGTDLRNSIGAYTKGNAVTHKPKITRTASDTKNTEVLAVRETLKQKKSIVNKGDTYYTAKPPITLASNMASVRNSSSIKMEPVSIDRRREENLRNFEAMLAQRASGKKAPAPTVPKHINENTSTIPVVNSSSSSATSSWLKPAIPAQHIPSVTPISIRPPPTVSNRKTTRYGRQ